mgnify:CR=1 FL=1
MNFSKRQEPFSFSRAFVQGELHLGIWSFFKKFVGVGNSFFVLSSLTLYQYGVYQLLLSFYAIVSDFFHDLFASVTSNDIARFIGERKEAHAKRLFLEYARFRLFMAAIPLVGTFFIASSVSHLYGPEAILWVQILGILFMVDAILALAMILLKLRLEFRIVATRPAFQKFIQLAVLAYFFFFSSIGIKEVLLAQLLAPLITLVFLIPAIIRVYHPWRSLRGLSEGIFVSVVRSYGKWEIPQSLLRDLVAKVRPWIIKFFLTTEAVGIFGVANTAVSLLKDLIPMRTLSTLVPRKVSDRGYLNFLFAYGTKYYLLLGAGLVVIGGVGFPIAIKFLFPHFSSAIPLFYILLPTVLFFAFIKIISIFLVVERRQRFIFYFSLFQSVITLAFLVGAVSKFGLMGIALAEVFALGIAILVKYRYLLRQKFIKPFSFGTLFTFTQEDRRILSILHLNIFAFLKKK